MRIEKPLVVIVGPTAVGKTEIAIELAERLDGEIVSADSRLFYRGMDIGTAKPTPAERERIAHHLIDIANPDEHLSLAVFQRAAWQMIEAVHARGRLPILTGGTGQYVRSVTDTWEIPPVSPDARLRAALETWVGEVGAQGLHNRLSVIDPQAAEKIDWRNLRRTVRALEVIFSTGEKFSAQRSRAELRYPTLQIGLTRPRAELYDRIDERIRSMFQAGLLEEVQRLLDQGYSPELPTLSAIGYREVIDYLSGKHNLAEAETIMRRRTRILVRRQANWFKVEDASIHWFRVGDQTIDKIDVLVSSWLSDCS
jgi:tRNA dimethylallyltransferase